MKTKIQHLLLACISTIFLGGILASCSDKLSELQLPYLFRPINFAVSVSGVNATFSWAAVDSAKSYTIQISQDSLQFSNIISTTTTTNLSYSIELAGLTRYSARVRANASDTTKNSKFNSTLTFKTPAENIFSGFGTNVGTGTLVSAYMTAMNSLDIKWLPGANVTHLILTASGVRDSVPISSAEALAGAKTVTGLTNASYTVQIYNNTRLRGTTTGLVEGDVYVTTGAQLASAIASATAGQVIVLAPSTTYSLGSAKVSFPTSVKLRGLQPTNRPVVCMTSGSVSTTSTMLGFTASSTMDYVKFENIDITGYADNNTSGTKIGYLFNNSTMATVGTLSFTNCLIRNFSNTPMRLQGSTGQRISNLTFLGCTIYDIGFGSTYAIVNVNNTTDYIDNISFTNCTAFNFKGSFILRTATSVSVSMGSIAVTNCTFNQSTQDGTTTRCFIDANGVTGITSGIKVQNCIFGSNGTIGAGIRAGTTASPLSATLTGNYYTSDFNDNSSAITATFGTYSIMGKITSYSGASTALWNSPTTGDFTLKDATFAGKGSAGDLRWY